MKLSSAVSELPWAVCSASLTAKDGALLTSWTSTFGALSKQIVGEVDGLKVAALKIVVAVSFPAVTSP